MGRFEPTGRVDVPGMEHSIAQLPWGVWRGAFGPSDGSVGAHANVASALSVLRHAPLYAGVPAEIDEAFTVLERHPLRHSVLYPVAVTIVPFLFDFVRRRSIVSARITELIAEYVAASDTLERPLHDRLHQIVVDHMSEILSWIGRYDRPVAALAIHVPALRVPYLAVLEGASELDARPVRAAVEPGEAAILRVILRRPVPRAGELVPSRARVTVRTDAGAEVFAGEVDLTGPREMRAGLVTVRTEAALAPGLYHAEVSTPDAPWHPRSAATGFWVKDEALLGAGPRLSASRDWLRADGKVLPVVGTTYMASDVHRKFLFEPNPHVWDRDFAYMKRQGINMVRTGLWTAWTRVMLDPGAVDENVLSALDAYVLTAAKHGILVCFNFFAFICDIIVVSFFIRCFFSVFARAAVVRMIAPPPSVTRQQSRTVNG